MRYIALSLLIIAACTVRVNPQAGPLEKSCQPNAPDQLGVITPPKAVDFKIIVIVPPKNLDRGIVRNWCSGPKQIGCADQSDVPVTEENPRFKTPPAKIKNRDTR
jgi:hypothetical protein